MQHLIDAVGNPRARFATKEARAAKLLEQWNTLHAKMSRMIERGNGTSETARAAYGVLCMMETGIRIGNESSSEGYEPIKTEFVLIEGKYTPIKKMVDGVYSPVPELQDVVPRYARYEGDWYTVENIPAVTVQTYGLTTLLHEHVEKGKKSFTLSFTGKKAVEQELVVTNPTLVKYRPTGNAGELWLGIDYWTLYKFIKKSIGPKYKPKDLRTAAVNRMFCQHFHEVHEETFLEQSTKSGRKAVLRAAIGYTAETIGHTVGVCRSAYLSPNLLHNILLARSGTIWSGAATKEK